MVFVLKTEQAGRSFGDGCRHHHPVEKATTIGVISQLPQKPSSHLRLSCNCHIPNMRRNVPLVAERILHPSAAVAVRMIHGF